MTRWASLVVVAILAVACSSATSASTPTTARSGFVDLGATTTRLQWESGTLTLDPPGSSQSPKISARTAFLTAGSTSHADVAEVIFGLFTDTELGRPGRLEIDKRPAWIVWHRRALVQPKCAYQRPPSRCGPVMENTLVVVDAATGHSLVGYDF